MVGTQRLERRLGAMSPSHADAASLHVLRTERVRLQGYVSVSNGSCPASPDRPVPLRIVDGWRSLVATGPRIWWHHGRCLPHGDCIVDGRHGVRKNHDTGQDVGTPFLIRRSAPTPPRYLPVSSSLSGWNSFPTCPLGSLPFPAKRGRQFVPSPGTFFSRDMSRKLCRGPSVRRRVGGCPVVR